MLSKFIDDIPTDFQPKESEHKDINEAYRGTINTDDLNVVDFLPSFIECGNRRKQWGKSRSFFSVSLFSNEEDLKNNIQSIPTLNNKIKSISKGYTTLKRGISVLSDNSTHIDYFLYDHKNNNPYSDFNIIERR